jgi:hypothetical protein
VQLHPLQRAGSIDTCEHDSGAELRKVPGNVSGGE